MPVKVAGYNIDADLLERIKIFIQELKHRPELEEIDIPTEIEHLFEEDNLTPETISAAYARISRDPNSVGELRKIALQSVARARRSNTTIVFDYGHASVAEHAVFNVDVTGISRLAVETIESRRLMSFTEKSQRYIALAREFVIPPELKSFKQGDELRTLCEELFEAYHQYLPVIEKYFKGKGEKRPELLAREDARYLLPLASAAQLGMTANARNIEHLLRRTCNHPLKELLYFCNELREKVEKIAPSLIKHIDDKGPEETITPKVLETSIPDAEVKLVKHTPDTDIITLAGLLFSRDGLTWEDAYKKSQGMNDGEKKSYLKGHLKNLKSYHSLPRFYETTEFGFQVVISSAAFGQLKRHRISTQLQHSYNPALGYTTPESIKEAGLSADFDEKMKKSEELYKSIGEEFSLCAPYALTNAHRKVVYFGANAREMHHLARMRMDKSAQWDIRRLTAEMVRLAREKAPITLALACGKDEFDDIAKEFFK